MTEEQKEKKLRERLKAEYHACFQALKAKLPSDLTGQTAEIAAATLVYQQMQEDGWSREFLDHLLRFRNPLEMVKDLYLEEHGSPHTEEFCHLFRDMLEKGSLAGQEVMMC